MQSYAQRISDLITGQGQHWSPTTDVESCFFSINQVDVEGDKVVISTGTGQIVLDCHESTFMDERTRLVEERVRASIVP